MSDMVYPYLNSAEKIAEATFQGTERGSGKTMTFSFRLDHTCYDKEGNDVGRSVRFEVKYRTNKGGSYVKVTWAKTFTEETRFVFDKDLVWEEIADHDSCWRGCWDDIFSWVREELLDKFTGEGNEFWFFSCEDVSVEPKEERND